MAVLVLLFLLTALLYATVGFGGGSTYNALLVLSGVDYRILPIVALACNIIVVAGGVWRFGAAGLIDGRRIAPWIIASAPAAFVGGAVAIPERAFVGLLGLVLLVAGAQLLAPQRAALRAGMRKIPAPVALAGGGAIGFLSGLTGVGGGVFLAPLLHFSRWDEPRRIAGASSLFILVNSLAGLAGQVTKLMEVNLSGVALAYWPLAAAVLIGGQIGSRLGATRLPEIWLRRVTGLLILYVAARLLIEWAGIR